MRGDGSCRVVLSILLSRISRAIYLVEGDRGMDPWINLSNKMTILLTYTLSFTLTSV